MDHSFSITFFVDFVLGLLSFCACVRASMRACACVRASVDVFVCLVLISVVFLLCFFFQLFLI